MCRLISSIKIYRFENGLRKHDAPMCYLHDIHLRAKDADRLKVKGGGKIYHANSSQNRAQVVRLVSGNVTLNQNRH
jgi:hypothetical protein